MMGSLIFSKQHCLFLKHLEAGFCIDLLNQLPTLFRHFLQEAFLRAITQSEGRKAANCGSWSQRKQGQLLLHHVHEPSDRVNMTQQRPKALDHHLTTDMLTQFPVCKYAIVGCMASATRLKLMCRA